MRKLLIGSIVALASCVGTAASATSDMTMVVTSPNESVRWRTITQDAPSTYWLWPSHSTKATLTIVKDGTSTKTYEVMRQGTAVGQNYVLEDLTVAASTRDEAVYSLTLAFDSGERRTATLGRVTGVNGLGTRCVVPPTTTENNVVSVDYTDHAWQKSSTMPMIPIISADATRLTINGDEVAGVCDGRLNWAHPKLTAGTHQAELLLADGTILTRTLFCVAGGYTFYIR